MKLEHDISVPQAGFTEHFSTLDRIFVAKQLIRRGKEYDYSDFFFDFSKAFDSVKAYANIIEFINDNATMEIALDGEKK